MDTNKFKQNIIWSDGNSGFIVFLTFNGELILQKSTLKYKQIYYNSNLNEALQKKSKYFPTLTDCPIRRGTEEDEESEKLREKLRRLPFTPTLTDKNNFWGGIAFWREWELRSYLDKTEEVLISFLPKNKPIEWEQIKLFLKWLNVGGSWDRVIYKKLRQIVNDRKTKSWDEVLSSSVVEWAYQQFDNWREEGYDCMDNYRVADIHSTSQKRRYRKAKERGCCGFYDEKMIGPFGKIYLIGFNYGH